MLLGGECFLAPFSARKSFLPKASQTLSLSLDGYSWPYRVADVLAQQLAIYRGIQSPRDLYNGSAKPFTRASSPRVFTAGYPMGGILQITNFTPFAMPPYFDSHFENLRETKGKSAVERIKFFCIMYIFVYNLPIANTPLSCVLK